MQKVRKLLRKDIQFYVVFWKHYAVRKDFRDGRVKYQLWTQTHSKFHSSSFSCPPSVTRGTAKKYLTTWQKKVSLFLRAHKCKDKDRQKVLVYLAEDLFIWQKKSIYSGERRRKRRNSQRAAMVFKECTLTVHKSKCCTKRKLILHFILSCSNFFSFQPSGWPQLHWLLKRNVNCLIL